MNTPTGPDLHEWRIARGWDKAETARRLRQVSNGTPVAGLRTLARMVTSWERGDHEISERYELLFRQLGFPRVSEDSADVAWLAGREYRTRRLVWADIILSVVVTGLGVVVTLLLMSNSADTAAAHQAGVQALAAAQKAEVAQREGGAVVNKICTTMAQLPPAPAGDPRTNPSRAALGGVISTLHSLASDLGCGSIHT